MYRIIRRVLLSVAIAFAGAAGAVTLADIADAATGAGAETHPRDRITEDDPRWNCATMGDRECGPNVAPLHVPAHCFPLEGNRPGNTLWLQPVPGGGFALCTE